jgi:hypothetical protein
MRIIVVLLCLSAVIASCNNSDKAPDVSNIKFNLSTQRFERDLFGLDTINFASKLDQLQAKYPEFGENFIYTVLGADPKWPADTVASYVKGFIHSYRSVYDSSEAVFNNFSAYEEEIKKGIQYLKYYFPKYVPPKKIITFIGPLNGIGVAAADDMLCIGLHLHLGKDFSLYRSVLVRETYPDYLSRRFSPDYISVDCMKLLLQDLYPEKQDDRPLVEQMVEKGKRLYVLSKLLPKIKEYKLIGYTEEQMKAVYDHEPAVWDLFVQNNFLQTIDNNIIKNYIGEGPKTQELGEASPGNIGSFAGWQIVKKFMLKNPEYSLQQLMSADAEFIFQQAKYKP